ncbi:hypothetical protein HZC08_00340 [Candidatus Micrarchaeota archaeon]|nr:hypothetical protein [Candidatus Micrarchaeota archaeon]
MLIKLVKTSRIEEWLMIGREAEGVFREKFSSFLNSDPIIDREDEGKLEKLADYVFRRGLNGDEESYVCNALLEVKRAISHPEEMEYSRSAIERAYYHFAFKSEVAGPLMRNNFRGPEDLKRFFTEGFGFLFGETFENKEGLPLAVGAVFKRT